MLIAQPWGRQYQDRGTLTSEQRATAQIQQELYFKRLSYAHPVLWEAICESFAGGDHWPSIDELKRAIQANQPDGKPTELLDPHWSNAPEPVALVMAHHKREACMIREAAVAVLPRWIKDNLEHSDAGDARAFLVSAQGNFGMKQRKVTT